MSVQRIVRQYKFILPMVCLAVVGMTWTGAPADESDDDEGPFPKQVAGAYFLEFNASALAELPPDEDFFLPAIVTFHADGTALGLDGTDEGLGGIEGFSINTPSQGNWIRTGDKSVQSTSLYLSFLRPEDVGVSGVLEAITELTLVANFASDFRTGEGLVCQQNQTIPDGQYNPDRDNPLEQLPAIKCTEDFPIAVPFTFERIQ